LISVWALLSQQYNPPYLAAGRTVYRGQQLSPGRSAAAAVMAHVEQQRAQHDAALSVRHVRLIVHHHLAAAVVLDAQEPRREGAEELLEGLGG